MSVNLHKELWSHCFTYLPLNNIKNLMLTCKDWNDIVRTELFWQQICFRELGDIPKDPQMSWKEFLEYGAIGRCIGNIRNSDFVPRKSVLLDPGMLASDPANVIFTDSCLIKKMPLKNMVVWDLDREALLEQHDLDYKEFPFWNKPLAMKKTVLKSIAEISKNFTMTGHGFLNESDDFVYTLSPRAEKKKVIHYVNTKLPELNCKFSVQVRSTASVFHLLRFSEDYIFFLDQECIVKHSKETEPPVCKIFSKTGVLLHELKEESIDLLGAKDQFIYYGNCNVITRLNIQTKESSTVYPEPLYNRPTFNGFLTIAKLNITHTHLIYKNRQSLVIIDHRNKTHKIVPLGFEIYNLQDLGAVFLCSNSQNAAFVDIRTAKVLRTIKKEGKVKRNFDFHRNKLVINESDSIEIHDFSS